MVLTIFGEFCVCGRFVVVVVVVVVNSFCLVVLFVFDPAIEVIACPYSWMVHAGCVFCCRNSPV